MITVTWSISELLKKNAHHYWRYIKCRILSLILEDFLHKLRLSEFSMFILIHTIRTCFAYTELYMDSQYKLKVKPIPNKSNYYENNIECKWTHEKERKKEQVIERERKSNFLFSFLLMLNKNKKENERKNCFKCWRMMNYVPIWRREKEIK